MPSPSAGPTSRFLKACRQEPTDTTPVWFMRQAGRYLPEYMEVRAGHHPILEVCKTPELAVEVTMQPIPRFAVDAAIIFADILLPLEPMGADLSFAAGEGPVIANPVRTGADVKALRGVAPGSLDYVCESIRQCVAALDGHVPLIGFAGAPFTLASYLIEGGGSRNYVHTKRLMYAEPDAWRALMNHLADAVGTFLVEQVQAGAEALQVFDSWVGALSPADYVEYVQPYSRKVFDTVRAAVDVPTIHFGTGTATILPHMAAAGSTVMGVDWRYPLDEAWAALGHRVAVQGNLDPVCLFGPPDEIERRVADILARAAGRPGHIFNLGHGILPGTPPEAVALVTDLVHGRGKG